MSNPRLAGIIAVCIVVPIVIAAIAASGPKPPARAGDYSTLLLDLRESGASVVEEGEIPRDAFFDIEGKTVAVDGRVIQVFEYENAEAMESEASCVSFGGFGITKERGDVGMHKEVNWIGLPHFYKAGRIIVIYVGQNSSVISLLENALGAQFAGM